MGLIFLSILLGLFISTVSVIGLGEFFGHRGWNWIASLEGGIVFGLIVGILATYGLYRFAFYLQYR